MAKIAFRLRLNVMYGGQIPYKVKNGRQRNRKDNRLPILHD